MRAFLLLLRVQALGLVNSLAPKRRGTRSSRVGRLAGIGLVMLLLGGMVVIYMVLMGINLVEYGLADAIPVLAVVMGSLAGVVFTFMKARGTLFGARDFDLVQALPIPRRTVVAARLSTLFGANIALAVVFMAPLFAVYFAHEGAAAGPVAFAAASIVLAPLAPTALAAGVAFGITALAARFRHASLAYVVLGLIAMLALIAGIYGFSFFASIDGDAAAATMAESLSQVRDAMGAAWPPASFAGNAVVQGSAAAFLGFAAVSLAVPALALEIMQRFYLEIDGMLRAHAGHRGAPVKLDGQVRSPFFAIMVKEWRTLIGIPSYAFNFLFGYLFMMAVAVALAAIGLGNLLASGAVEGIELTLEETAQLSGLLDGLTPWVFAFCAIMCPSAVISISLEGRSAWIMSCAPVSTRTLLGAKLASNALPCGGTLAVCTLILLASGQVGVLAGIETLVLGFGIFYLWVNVGLHIDARQPNFDWVTPNEVVKRGTPVFVSVFGGLACVFAGGFATAVLFLDVGPEAAHALVICLGILFICAGQLIFRNTSRRGCLSLG